MTRAIFDVEEIEDMLLEQISPAAANTQVESDYEYRECRDGYVGLVRFREFQYEFMVRDTRREGPTIFGAKSELSDAAASMRRVLNALAARQ